MNQHTLPADNGSSIVVSTFEPATSPSSVVIVPSAMGVAQGFYARFAQWLTQHGHAVVTFDYRGVGLSAPPTLRGYRADIFDWVRDCEAVIDFAAKRFGDVPLYWIGHSLGGQVVGLIRNRERIARVVTVASGNGYWLENAWPTKRLVWWMWFVAVPIATRIAGYFPGKRLRKVGDLPRGVIQQWRRWCLDPEYVVGAEGNDVRAKYSAVRTPIVSVSFTDDELMSERGIHTLHRLYTNAPVQFHRIAPRDVGAARIGHFGFFRPQFEQTLWQRVPRWLAGEQT